MRRRGRRAAFLAGLLVAAWLGGFAWFLSLVPDRLADPDTVTDAIVVLTGGSLRLETGMALLAQDKAKWLFITGVHRGVAVPELLRQAGAREDAACCIVLGHAAESTFGNALETSEFMRAHDFHSLRLVTASYHMPRSLLEFARAMPQVRIVPNPVFPKAASGRTLWETPLGLAIAGEEYAKYLVALARALVPAAS